MSLPLSVHRVRLGDVQYQGQKMVQNHTLTQKPIRICNDQTWSRCLTLQRVFSTMDRDHRETQFTFWSLTMIKYRISPWCGPPVRQKYWRINSCILRCGKRSVSRAFSLYISLSHTHTHRDKRTHTSAQTYPLHVCGTICRGGSNWRIKTNKTTPAGAWAF